MPFALAGNRVEAGRACHPSVREMPSDSHRQRHGAHQESNQPPALPADGYWLIGPTVWLLAYWDRRVALDHASDDAADAECNSVIPGR